MSYFFYKQIYDWICYRIPWICYERSFNEFYLSVCNQLVSIKGFSCLFRHLFRFYWLLLDETKCFFQHIGKITKWISELNRKNPLELKGSSRFYVNYFLRYHLMMQHQPIVKKSMERMGEQTGLTSSYQLLITVACTNAGSKMKGGRHRAADRCPFVPRHS